MIDKIEFEGEIYEFGPKLNIVRGSNASGKTRLLKAIAKKCNKPYIDVMEDLMFRSNEAYKLLENLVIKFPEKNTDPLILDGPFVYLGIYEREKLLNLMKKQDYQIIITLGDTGPLRIEQF